MYAKLLETAVELALTVRRMPSRDLATVLA